MPTTSLTGRRRPAAVAVVLAMTFVGAILVLAATSPTRPPAVGSRGAMLSRVSLLETGSPAPFQPEQLRAGRAPDADDEIVLDLSTALAQGIRLGDAVSIRGPQSGTLRVVGLVAGDSDGRLASIVPLVLGGVLVVAGVMVVRSAIAGHPRQRQQDSQSVARSAWIGAGR